MLNKLPYSKMTHLHLYIKRAINMITSLSRTFHTAQAHLLSNAVDHHQNPYHHLRHIQLSGSNPDRFTISKALSFYAKIDASDEGKQLHAFLLKRNVPMDVAAINSLINLYCKCGSVEDAEKVFGEMPERDVYSWTVMVYGYVVNGRMNRAVALFDDMPTKNTVSWNSLISGFQALGCEEMAFELFYKMRGQGETPNKVTFISVLKACNSWGRLSGVHCVIVKSSWVDNVVVACTLMDMYAKFGDILACRKSFEEITEHSVVSWSILLSGFAMNGKILDAESIFETMPGKNIVAWNTMITAYIQNGMHDKTFSLFVEMMNSDTKPNCFTMTSLLSGCSIAKYAKKGKSFHAYVIKEGLQSDTTVNNALITMYGEQGNIQDASLVFETMHHPDFVSWTAMVAVYISNCHLQKARRIFDCMPEKNLIAWNTMMYGYLQNAKCVEPNSLDAVSEDDALMFFCDMERSNIKPDHFSYNCALTACANAEALDQARAIQCRTIKIGFDSDLGVGNALITAYGKCGSLNEAENCFRNISSPDMISWNALLTCYSQNGQGNEVLKFYEEMRNSGVEPNHVTFISLLSACSYLGEVKKGQEFFGSMEKDHGVVPTREHYTCIVDLLGRAGLLDEAEAVIINMPIVADAAVWGALLGACKMHGVPEIGRRAADQIFQLEPNNSSAYIALAETFAAARMWGDVSKARAVIKRKKLIKEPGCSWINIRNKKHVFLSGDHCYLEKDSSIYESLYILYGNIIGSTPLWEKLDITS